MLGVDEAADDITGIVDRPYGLVSSYPRRLKPDARAHPFGDAGTLAIKYQVIPPGVAIIMVVLSLT